MTFASSNDAGAERDTEAGQQPDPERVCPQRMLDVELALVVDHGAGEPAASPVRCKSHDDKRQHAGEGPKPDRRDENQRQDDLVDAAHHVQHLAHEVIDRGMRREIARREHADRQREDHAEDRAPHRDLQAFNRGLPQSVDEGEVRRHHAGDEIRHVGHAVEEVLRIDLCADGGPPQDDEADGQGR